MISVVRVCERCGAKISGDATPEICPACLLENGLFEDEAHSVADRTPLLHGRYTARSIGILSDFGDYELLEEIGRGGQGVVYRAHQKSLNRTVALKVIGLGPWTTEKHLKRFRREAEAAAHLEHPCIVPIYEVGEHDAQCYFSMKFVEGGQLDEVIKREPISIRQATELVAKLARTVHYAHEHGILHRDIKPGNILLDQNGEAHLTDFGLAQLVEAESTVTATLDVLGTPSYMAPEQAAGEHTVVSKATDVYGLGAVLYQLLTGQPPFAGRTTYDTIKLLLGTKPRQPRLLNPKIERELCTICLTCLEKDPQRRYPSALALAEDLEHWLKHEPIRAKPSGVFVHGRKWVRRKPAIAALIASLVALGTVVSWNIWKSDLFRPPPEKSIAVLPFERLNSDPDDAYFADGLQEQILNDLARIADLKVIGPTSTMQYKGGVARDLRKIGHDLGVANVVEGSALRSGNRMRVNVRLVDSRTQRELWGQTYDRDLGEFFAMDSQIAIAIAGELHTRLSPNEKSEIERPATSNMAALNLYTRAENLLLTSFSSVAKPKLLQAAELLNQAVARDPSFFQAYCRLAHTHDLLYFLGFDHTPARLALAEAALQAAFRLRPNAGEAHLARAENLYEGRLDYDGARAELDFALQSLPNNPRVFELKGYVERRQGHWEQSTRDLERSIELDPRNFFTLQQIALSYGMLHRYAEETSVVERALAIEPDDVDTQVELAAVQFHWKADTKPYHKTIDSIRATNPDALPNVANDWLSCALAERDLAAARNALYAFGDTPLTDYTIHLSRPLIEGVLARLGHDDEKARLLFTAARTEQEKIVHAQPDYGPALCVLGLIDAALGRKDDALREGRRAVELVPVTKEAISGPLMIEYLAMIAAWAGDKDLACQQLAIAARPPGTISYGQLKMLPWWDPLRGDQRFEQIVASLAPGSVANSAPDKSIAVLPFENLSRDPDNAYFGVGVQEEILTRLAKIADLKVISRGSTQRYHSKPTDLGEIAKQLGVVNLVEGSVQKKGDQVRVTVQLVNAETGAQLWADSYDRKLTDVFSVESDIARAIAETLNAKLTGLEVATLTSRPTENNKAHDLYLRGRFFWNKRTSADIKTALGYFQQAANVDPNYAAAYAGISDCYLLLPLYGGGVPRELYPKAIAMAQKAISLDPNLGEPHASLGLIHALFDFDFPASVREFEEAIRLNPNYGTAHHWFGDSVLPALGEFDRANAEAKRALDLDPLSVVYTSDAGTVYWITGRYAEAVAQFRKAIEMDPHDYTAHWQLGQALERVGDLPGAIAEYEKATQLDDDPLPLGLLGAAKAKTGDRATALLIIKRLQKIAKERYVPDYSFALIHLALGDSNGAMNWLESSYAKHQPDVNWIRVDPDLRRLHGDRRFQALAEKIVPAREFNAQAASQ